MSLERLHINEANAIDHADIHLGELRTDQYPILKQWGDLGDSLMNSIQERKAGLVSPDSMGHYIRRLGKVRDLISNASSGLVVRDANHYNVPKIASRITNEFKDVTGLDDESAKLWSERACAVLDKAKGLTPLTEEEQAFLEADIMVFLDRLKKPTTIDSTPDISY